MKRTQAIFMAVALCLALLVGSAAYALDKHALPGPFMNELNNADVVIGTRAGDVVTYHTYFNEDEIPELSVDATGVYVSADTSKKVDFVFIRAMETDKNTDPGRWQEFFISGDANYTLLLGEEGVSGDLMDFGVKDDREEVIALSGDFAIRWNACCPVFCSDVYKNKLFVSGDTYSEWISFDVYVGILDCGVEKAWQFLPSTYNTVKAPYATFAHRDDMIILWDAKPWNDIGTHQVYLGPFVVEQDKDGLYAQDWLVESVWNKMTYYMSADNGATNSLPHHGWQVVGHASVNGNTATHAQRFITGLEAVDQPAVTDFANGPITIASDYYQYIGFNNIRSQYSWAKNWDAPYIKLADDPFTPPGGPTVTLSKDITPKHVAFFGVPMNMDTFWNSSKSDFQPVHMIYTAWDPKTHGGYVVSSDPLDWEIVPPNFCEYTHVQPQVFYPSECLLDDITVDPCANKIFTFRARTLSSAVFANVAEGIAVEADDVMDVCEEGCDPVAETKCNITVAAPCNNVVYKAGELTITWSDPHKDYLATIAPYRVAVVFNKNDFKNDVLVQQEISDAFAELPGIGVGPINALFSVLSIGNVADTGDYVDMGLLAAATKTDENVGLNNYFRVFPEKDKNYSVKEAWEKKLNLELSFYVVFVDGVPADGGPLVRAQDGYFIVYDNTVDPVRTIATRFALMTKCASEPTVTPTPEEGVAYKNLQEGYTTEDLSDEEKAEAEKLVPEGKVCSVELAADTVTGHPEDSTKGAIIEVTAYSEYLIVAQKTDGTWETLELPTASDFALAAVDEYEIADGGDFDLSDEEGKVEFKVAVCKLADAPTPTTGGDGGSSGCNTGFAPLALLLLAPLAVLLKK